MRDSSRRALTLADFLRHELGLTGTHLGCEHGVCGACTVLVDGQFGALVPDVRGAGERLRGHDRRGARARRQAQPLQQAFVDNHGLQCGFCTPGMLITLTELLRDNPDPTEQEVREAITRQSLPLHRLCRHRGGGARCGEAHPRRTARAEPWA